MQLTRFPSAIVLAGLLCMCALLGCETAPMQYSSVELRGLLAKELATPEYPVFLNAGESAIVNDPHVAERLAAFFPGLGSGRKAFIGIKSPKNLELVFSRGSGERIIVYTRLYEYWGSDMDQGDLSVKGDLLGYLRALFADVEMKKSDAMKRGE